MQRNEGAVPLVSDCFLVAIGYHGNLFHGSQIQPNIRTVQGALVEALKEIGWWSEGCLRLSSRTDSGVSVRMNLASIDLPEAVTHSVDGAVVIRALNDRLPEDLVAWSAKKVPSTTPTRPVISRKYYYRCEVIKSWPDDVDINLLKKACQIFVGTHDFTNLCRLEEDKDPKRTVISCEPWLDIKNRPIGISVTAKSFLWNQVRRMASAITGVVSGAHDLDFLVSALEDPDNPIDMGMGSPKGLILWEINHSALEGMGMGSIPDTSIFSKPPSSLRGHNTWLGLCNLEMSTMVNSEWIREIDQS